MKIRSLAACFRRDGGGRDGLDHASLRSPSPTDCLTWTFGQLTVWCAPRQVPSDRQKPSDTMPTLLLGDDAEWNRQAPGTNLVNGVPIRYDSVARALIVHTSIVGLPPIFVYRDQGVVALASDIHLLASLAGVRLELDPVGVAELGRVGHPVGHRTLFANVEFVPAGGLFRIGPDGRGEFQSTWALPDPSPRTWDDFIEAQIAAFTEAVRRTDLKGSFLSLTAGLDTRTVFAALAQQERLIPAITMTGPQRSLDARIAGRLCRAYGIPHDLVTFDDRFTRMLPGHVEMASRLSGGLASLGQAAEVYFYDQIGARFQARLSGNLGNQIGRGGTEGVSVRRANLEVLAPRLRGGDIPGSHWLLEQLDRDERSGLQFILQHETAFTSVGNFSIGNHFAVQQSPYANRALVETLALRPPAKTAAPSGSVVRMLLRDLKHRFLGEPATLSFQRTLVKDAGGFAAHCPINWGWRAVGGVSPTGTLRGAATLVGMYAIARGLDDGVLRAPLAWAGLPALHDFRQLRRWLRHDLREFAQDTLRSRAARSRDVFDWKALAVVLDEHFGGRRNHYQTVLFALDLALAHRIFCGRA